MSTYVHPRKLRIGKPWDHSEPDLRESLRRVSRWQIDESADPMTMAIRRINGKTTPNLKKQFNHS